MVIAPGAGETADVAERIESVGMGVGALGASPARAAFEDGVGSFDRVEYDQAVLDFSRALVERPDWDQAHFNRAVAHLRSGRDAAGAADLEFYLELGPPGVASVRRGTGFQRTRVDRCWFPGSQLQQ